MRSLGFWVPFFTASACVFWIACSSDDPPAGPGTADASPDTAVVTAADTGGGSSRDCKSDLGDDKVYRHLDCTGLYSSFENRTVGEGVKPYKPGIEFWSDGAEKSRWIHLPVGSKIDISDWNEWVFPNGTKLWKEFKVGGKRIETRLFAKLDDGKWVHTTYRWNATETEATRLVDGESVKGVGPDGGPYVIPNIADDAECNQCHQGRKDQILGFDAVSLGIATATGQTLAALEADGRLSAKAPRTTLTIPEDTTGKAAPAFGWLHANCGSCHNDGPESSASHVAFKTLIKASELTSDAGAPTLTAYATGYCKDANRNEEDAGTRWRYLVGGAPNRSYASVLSGRRVGFEETPNPSQMPPIVTHAVDQGGHALLDTWITALPPCP